MRLPALSGVIRRRILVNFRVQPEVMQAALPADTLKVNQSFVAMIAR